MTSVTEIANDIFRISTYVRESNIQFNQFLVRDEQPLLFHTGHKRLFPQVRDAVATLIDPASLRWIGFSHMEADECGGLAEWQQVAPASAALCSVLGKRLGVDDFIALRPARAMSDGEILDTGRHRFRFLQTPQVPHGWDAGLLFEETQSVLLCSDLFHQNGDVEAVTGNDVVGRFRETLVDNRDSPVPGYMAIYDAHRRHAGATRAAEAEGLGSDARLHVRRRRPARPDGCSHDDARSARLRATRGRLSPDFVLVIPEPHHHDDPDLRLQQDHAAPREDPGRGAG